MSGREILIADKDARFRNRVAIYFQKVGYQVETANSAEETLNSVLEKEADVILLGSNVTEKAAVADLIKLLKMVDDTLHIILVSDEMTLAETRQVRAAGIFYHALRPATAGETDELRQAVTCAFEDSADRAAAPQSEPAPAEVALGPEFSRPQIGKALSWVSGMVALTFGAGALSLQAQPALGGGSLAIWIFLGFAALVVTNQMLPTFRVKLAAEGLRQWKAAHSNAHRDGK